MPRFLRLPLTFVVLVTFATALHAQTTPFTAEDILKVSAITVLDVTDDGRWLAEVPELPGVLAYGASRDEALGVGSEERRHLVAGLDEETQQLAGLVGRDSARHAEKDAGHHP